MLLSQEVQIHFPAVSTRIPREVKNQEPASLLGIEPTTEKAQFRVLYYRNQNSELQ